MVMKSMLMIVVLALCCFAFSQETPFACKLDKLTTQQREDLSKSIHQLIDAKPATKELPNGYEMRFLHGGDLFVAATTWIRYERECCPFFDFSITLDKNDGPMTIQLTGPKGVKKFIDDDLPALK